MKRILVVDDEAAITRLIKLNLEAAGGYLVFTENRADRVPTRAKELFSG
jgi:CheY-like chemotaxis protein